MELLFVPNIASCKDLSKVPMSPSFWFFGEKVQNLQKVPVKVCQKLQKTGKKAQKIAPW
jgi:hypothetical protein